MLNSHHLTLAIHCEIIFLLVHKSFFLQNQKIIINNKLLNNNSKKNYNFL